MMMVKVMAWHGMSVAKGKEKKKTVCYACCWEYEIFCVVSVILIMRWLAGRKVVGLTTDYPVLTQYTRRKKEKMNHEGELMN